MQWNRREMLKASAVGLFAGGLPACAGSSAAPQEEADELVTGAPVIDESDYTARREKARRLLDESDIDGLLITGGTALQYFAGFGWGASERLFAMVIFRRGEPAFVCPAFEEPRAREQTGEHAEVRKWEEDESPFEKVRDLFADRGMRTARVGVEERVRYFEARGLAKAAPHFEILPGDPVTIGCRAVKSAKELELQRRANLLTLKVYERAAARFEAGMTETETSQLFREEFEKAGAAGGAFALHAENSAFPHGTSNRRPLEEGMIVLFDGGCRINGYPSDMTRTVVFGEPSKRQTEVWNVVKEAQTAALEAARAGNPCGAVDDAARKVITAAGFGPDYKYFTHRLGHGIGMDGHEWPYMVRGNERLLEPGMTFSDEPGIYIYGEFGVRLEDIVYIDEDGKGRLFTPQSPSPAQPF